jgi:hypothetical protein
MAKREGAVWVDVDFVGTGIVWEAVDWEIASWGVVWV